MGHGSYQSKDWENLKKKRNISNASTVQELYQARAMKTYLNPYQVKYRESCIYGYYFRLGCNWFYGIFIGEYCKRCIESDDAGDI